MEAYVQNYVDQHGSNLSFRDALTAYAGFYNATSKKHPTVMQTTYKSEAVRAYEEDWNEFQKTIWWLDVTGWVLFEFQEATIGQTSDYLKFC